MMDFLGKQAKRETRVEPQPVEEVSNEVIEDIPNLPKPLPKTVIAKGVTMTGALNGEGIVEVEGTVEGEVHLTGSVIVSPTGLITGPVDADFVRVAGRIVGCVSARESLRLEKNGSLEGDVSTVSLVVEDGGRLNGRTTMLEPGGARVAPATEEKPLESLQFGPNFRIGDEENAAVPHSVAG
jgi:cytoskeletal protein CcmA (bactofilin family)